MSDKSQDTTTVPAQDSVEEHVTTDVSNNPTTTEGVATTETATETVEEKEGQESVVEENTDTTDTTDTQTETATDETKEDTPETEETTEEVVEDEQPVVEDESDEYVPTEVMKDFADTVYAEFKDLVVSLNINSDNFIIVVTKTLERIDRVSNMSGQEKYGVAILVLDKLIDEIPDMDDNDKYYVRNIVPSLIEIVISASKGKLKLNLRKVKRRQQINVGAVVEDLYTQIKDIIKENDYTGEYITRNVTVIVGMLMTAVEQYPDLTGAEKKAIVLHVVDKMIDDLMTLFPDMDPQLLELSKHTKNMLPTVVDILISVGRKHFEINATKYNNFLKRCLFCRS